MKKNRALPLTITFGSLLIVFTLALTTLWNIVLIYNSLKLKTLVPREEVWQQWVILGVGSFLFVVILVGLTCFVVLSSRQIMLNQLQKNFIDAVTHELKTPITSLKLYVETMQRHNLPPEKRAAFLDIMLSDLEHLDTLVGHVLESARVEYRVRESQFEPVELDRMLAECIDMMERRYPRVQGCIVWNPTELVFLCDPYALKLVLVNILDNGVKYAREVPEIRVETRPEGQELYLTFTDRGVGLSSQEIRRVFRRFYRGERASNIKGTGLGLFIVKETLKSLRGQIQVSSEGPGLGCTFTVRLPYRTPEYTKPPIEGGPGSLRT